MRLRERLWGPKLRTYAESCDELGGVPWRRFDATERWFIPVEEKASALDSLAIHIPRPGLISWLRGLGRGTWMIAGGTALFLVVARVVFALAR